MLFLTDELFKIYVFHQSFKTEEIFELIPQYARIADEPSGLCYLDKFAHKIGLALNEKLIIFFEMFDKVKFDLLKNNAKVWY